MTEATSDKVSMRGNNGLPGSSDDIEREKPYVPVSKSYEIASGDVLRGPRRLFKT